MLLYFVIYQKSKHVSINDVDLDLYFILYIHLSYEGWSSITLITVRFGIHVSNWSNKSQNYIHRISFRENSQSKNSCRNEYDCLLERHAVLSWWWRQYAHFKYRSISTETIRRHHPRQQSIHARCPENLKSHSHRKPLRPFDETPMDRETHEQTGTSPILCSFYALCANNARKNTQI
jgi:hypothetical protein